MGELSRRLQLTVGDAVGGGVSSPSPWGDSTPFENEFFEGRVFFVHEPPEGSGVPFNHRRMLAGRGETPPAWEVQIQGRFKQKTTDGVFLSLELRDGPMQLGLVTRALCKVILKVVFAMAKSRGLDFRHSFGNSSGERPLMAFPLMGADRIYVSDGPVSLPIMGDNRRGVFKVGPSGAIEADLGRGAAVPRTDCYMTFLFATPRVKFTTWTVDGIPGLGTLDLDKFWGDQALHMTVCDQPMASTRKVFFEVRIHAPLEVGGVDAIATAPVPMVAASREHSQSAGRAEPLRAQNVTEHTIAEQGSEIEPESDATVPANAAAADAAPTGLRPAVGSAVVQTATGRRGWLLVDDATDELPMKVQFADGVLPFSDWLPAAAVVALPPGEELPELAEAVGAVAAAAAAAVPPLASTSLGEASEMASLNEAGEEAVELYLQQMESALDADADARRREEGMQDWRSEEDEEPAAAAEPIALPWYFRSVGGSVWWCIEHRGRLCWRPQAKLGELCALLGGGAGKAFEPGLTFDDLERLRRWAGRLLAAARQAPGLLDEFLGSSVSLANLVGGTASGRALEPVGVVEAEGCIVERLAWFDGGVVAWEEPDVNGRLVSVRLEAIEVEHTCIAGAPALLVTTSAGRQYALAAWNDTSTARWATSLRAGNAVGARPSYASFSGENSKSKRRSGFWNRSGSAVRSEPPISRWPDGRSVLNGGYLCLEPPAGDALALSAQLLREALAAQSGGQEALLALVRHSAALKCVNLAALDERRVWCFWVNVFHCLLVHGRLVGMPSGLQQVVQFFNRTSYIVAGHVLSLTEIEHSLLRARMTPPRLKLKWVFMRVWARSDGELEERPCLAAPACPASQFRCRPDWRLNLVLSAGNVSSIGALPVFDDKSPEALEDLLDRACIRSLAMAAGPSVLPYSLYRYHDDAPAGAPGESFESRWSRAVEDLRCRGGSPPTFGTPNMRFSNTYEWKMRPSLSAM